MHERILLALTVVVPALAQAQSGFDYTQVFTDGLTEPMDVTFAGQSAIVADKCGRLHAFTLDGARTPLGDLGDRLQCEKPLTGLLGVEATRGYDGSGDLFVYYTSDQGIKQEVARFPLSGTGDRLSLNVAGGAVILPNLPWATNDAHNSGALALSAGGEHLFVGVGQNSISQSDDVQDPTRPYGKILRVLLSGAAPSDNPSIGGKPGGESGRLFALGLRRPFRIGTDSETGALWIGDSPQIKYAEINRATGGENFGWPRFEGAGHPGISQEPVGDPVDPVLEYEDYQGPDSLVVVGDAYRPPPGATHPLPESFHGAVPVADFYASWLRLVGPEGEILRTNPGIASPRAIATGPDGALYVVEASKKVVSRLAWADDAPAVTITTPAAGARFSGGDPLTLEGTATDSEDGKITAGFEWTLTLKDGDGAVIEEKSVSGNPASYAVPQSADLESQLTITLRVRDSVGSVGSATRTLYAEATRVTFNTAPEGIEYTVDGEALTGEAVQVWPAGLPVEVECPDEIVFEGDLLVFDGWTDGGEPAHTFVVPAADTDMICRYRDFDAPPTGDDLGPVGDPELAPLPVEAPEQSSQDGCQAAPVSRAPTGLLVLLLVAITSRIRRPRSREREG